MSDTEPPISCLSFIYVYIVQYLDRYMLFYFEIDMETRQHIFAQMRDKSVALHTFPLLLFGQT